MQLNKIGFLDPGFAGLRVMQSVVQRLPQHDFVYLACGVQARAAAKGLQFLFEQQCSIVVIPGVRLFQHLQPLSVAGKEFFGAAEPVALAATSQTRNNHIGIITRNDTKCAELFAAEIRRFAPETKIYQQSCPLLVPLIEAGRQQTDAMRMVLRGYLEPLIRGNIDVLILGNTQYGFIKALAEEIVGKQVKVIDEGTALSTQLAEFLATHPAVEQQMSRRNHRQFFCVDEAKKAFDALAQQFYGVPVEAREVTL